LKTVAGERSAGREIGQLGDALDGRCLLRALAQQLADRLENTLAALLLVALTQTDRWGCDRHPAKRLESYLNLVK
jgi:hypothetical protein